MKFGRGTKKGLSLPCKGKVPLASKGAPIVNTGVIGQKSGIGKGALNRKRWQLVPKLQLGEGFLVGLGGGAAFIFPFQKEQIQKALLGACMTIGELKGDPLSAFGIGTGPAF